MSNVPHIGTLPLILKRDELAAKLLKERNNPNAAAEAVLRDDADYRRLTLKEQSSSFQLTASLLSQANVVVWRPDLFDAAVYNAGLFAGTVMPLPLLPSTPQWWPVEVLSKSKTWQKWSQGFAPGITRHGYLVATVPADGGVAGRKNTLGGLECVDDGIARPILYVTTIITAKGIPGTSTSIAIGGDKLYRVKMMYNIIAALSFMAQEFVETKTFRYPSRFSAFRQKYVPMVNQVMLRAKHSDVVPGSQADCESRREYEHSWTVRGHWRKLHEPRRVDGQQVVWVRPHIKGDPEKPLLPPRDTIIKVCR